MNSPSEAGEKHACALILRDASEKAPFGVFVRATRQKISVGK
jgi:hypothetical protein